MNFVIENWMLVLVAVSSGAMLFLPALRGAAGHVGGAKNIPLGELEQKLAGTVKNKALPLILVCQSGARSGRAVAIAKKLGYTEVSSLGGGMGAWKSASLPVDKS